MAESDEDDLPIAHLLSKRQWCSASSREAPAGAQATHLSTERSRSSKGLSVKILTDALDFLSPPSLLLVLVCSKQVRHSLTYKVAVRSILLSGSEHGKTTLRCLMKLICGSAAFPEDRWMLPSDDVGGRIWIPSPCRLIRLAVGRRCEMPSCPNRGVRVSDMRPSVYFGGNKRTRDSRPLDNVNHIRPDWGIFACWHCTVNYGTMEVKSAKQKRTYNAALGHPRTCSSYGKYLWLRSANDGGEKIGPVVTVDVLDRLRVEGRTLNDFLTTDASGAAANSATAQELLAAFLPANSESHRIADKDYEIKQEKQAAKSAAKCQKFDGIVQGLQQSLNGEHWTNLAMNSSIVRHLLQPFRKAPSKFTRKVANQLEIDIRMIFKNVDASMIGLSFFGDSVFQQALKSCGMKIGTKLFTDAPKQFYELINGSHCKEAVLTRVPVTDVFAQAVVAKLGAIEPADTALAADFFQAKAQRSCCNLGSGPDELTSYFTECERAFPDMLNDYELIRRTAQRYCSLEWLGDAESKDLPGIHIRQTIFTGTSGGKGRGVNVRPTRPGKYLSLLESGSDGAFRSLASQQKTVNVDEVTACFDENSMLLTPEGYTRVGDLRAGDAVVTHRAAVGRVVCVTRGAKSCQEMCEVSGIWLTPQHPVRIDGVWVKPKNVAVPTRRSCRVVNLVLDSGHVVFFAGTGDIALEAVTLAHQGRDAAAGVATDFWGSADCFDFLCRQVDFPEVLLPKVDFSDAAAVASSLQFNSSL